MENIPKHIVHVGHNIQGFRVVILYSQAGFAHEPEGKRGNAINSATYIRHRGQGDIEDDQLLKQMAEFRELSSEALEMLYIYCINLIGEAFNNNSSQINQSQPL